MNEQERMFYTVLVKCIAVIVIVLIMSVTAYQIIDIAGPIKPRQSSIYYWPPTMGTTINGNTNTLGAK